MQPYRGTKYNALQRINGAVNALRKANLNEVGLGRRLWTSDSQRKRATTFAGKMVRNAERRLTLAATIWIEVASR